MNLRTPFFNPLKVSSTLFIPIAYHREVFLSRQALTEPPFLLPHKTRRRNPQGHDLQTFSPSIFILLTTNM
jgi:hypothetical protein